MEKHVVRKYILELFVRKIIFIKRHLYFKQSLIRPTHSVKGKQKLVQELGKYRTMITTSTKIFNIILESWIKYADLLMDI